tara:strand:+ start:269 stop:451 length:183 start_codon:yes stop_codon:yes gene_type:complete
MVAFARARTKSWLSRLWSMPIQQITTNKVPLEKSMELLDRQAEQNKRFLEMTKQGGIWFS